MGTPSPILRVENLTVRFGTDVVLDDVHFTLNEGETLAIIGPNGAGKTVLLRAILGLVPFEGTITMPEGIEIGYVPQRLSVDRDLPLTVEEFLMLRSSDMGKIEKLLREIDPFHGTATAEGALHNVRAFLAQRLGVLSGGQLQKVLIAWALLKEPRLLLFDEPTAGLDVGGEETVYALLHRLKEERRFTVLFVSHDLSVVYRFATNVLCLNRRNLCFGPPREALDPKILEALYGYETGFFAHDGVSGGHTV